MQVSSSQTRLALFLFSSRKTGKVPPTTRKPFAPQEKNPRSKGAGFYVLQQLQHLIIRRIKTTRYTQKLSKTLILIITRFCQFLARSLLIHILSKSCLTQFKQKMGFNFEKKKRDFVMIFATRMMRMFSYGLLALVFLDNLLAKGFSSDQASWIQSSIVFGDICISLILTTHADRFGRINSLMLGSLLRLITGFVYAESSNVILITVSGILGVISVSGGEIGPFMAIEQSALAQLVEECSDEPEHIPSNVSAVFGYYNMAGNLSQAAGAALAGIYINASVNSFSTTKNQAIQNVVRMYALMGALMFVGYFMMNKDEMQTHASEEKKVLNCTGIKPNNLVTVLTLSCLFAIDAMGAAFIVQSFLSFYYEKKYDLHFDKIGSILFICNIISGISGVLSSKMVDRFGAIATIIYTHLPSNIFLLSIAFVQTPIVSIVLLFARFSISQMDVPARQTFVSMVVSSEERSAANGITNIARSLGLCVGLSLNSFFMKQDPDSFEFSCPFLIAGALTIIYDVSLGCCFLWREGDLEKDQMDIQKIGNQQLDAPQIAYAGFKDEES